MRFGIAKGCQGFLGIGGKTVAGFLEGGFAGGELAGGTFGRADFLAHITQFLLGGAPVFTHVAGILGCAVTARLRISSCLASASRKNFRCFNGFLVEFSQAVFLGKTLGSGSRCIARCLIAIPAPQIAVKRDQPLAVFQLGLQQFALIARRQCQSAKGGGKVRKVR